MGQDTQNREIRGKLEQWAAGKPDNIPMRCEYICSLLARPDADTPEVRRSLMQQVHILRWQIDNPR